MSRGKKTELLLEKCGENLPRRQLSAKNISQVEIYAPILKPVREIKMNGESMEPCKNNYVKYSEIEKYYSESTKKFGRVEAERKKLSGMPAVKGTRIPVSLIVACLKDEMTFGEICEEYGVEKKDIEEAMEYVIEILDAPYQEGLE